VTAVTHCHSLPSAKRLTLDKENFLFFVISLPSVVVLTLGKDILCRVPGMALGKDFYFFSFCIQNFSVALLQYMQLHVQYWYILRFFAIFS
jgi:hypothetical protein